jgi:hypothetical protein
MSMTITVSTNGPRDPQYVLELAEGLAESVRVLCHLTRDHGALEYPSEADRLIREVSSAVHRLDQLLAQAGGWLERERREGRIGVTGGPFTGDPGLAAVRARLSLDEARACLTPAVTALDAAASVTSCMEAREDGGDD